MTSKELGNNEFKQKNFAKAIEHYTQAISENPSDHTIYSNRSASFHNLKNFDKALEDANKCVQINADWGKGYQRKGMAYHGMKKFQEAMEAYGQGIERDPQNAQIKAGLQQVITDKRMSEQKPFSQGPPGGMGGGMPGMGGPGGMFGGPEAEAKLKSNPRIAQYFNDPMFKNKWEGCQEDPQMMMQLIQTDPRFMDVFKELTGVDLLDMQEKEMKNKQRSEDAQKIRMAASKKKKEEDELKKQEEAEAALPEEERILIQNKKQADAHKKNGNELYMKKKFEEALAEYSQAIAKDPEEITYHTNKAAVYFEMKNYDACIESCDGGIEIATKGQYDYVKLSKAMARKANAFVAQGKFDEGIALYQKALIENQDHAIKMGLQKAQRTKKEVEAKAYINPEMGEEHRLKGNELFKAGEFVDALKQYEEGIKRDPKAHAIYSNRSVTYVKLMDFNSALKDADKAIELKPDFVKAYARKGNCHHMMKEYHKALKAFDDGLKIDKDNKDCNEGKNKTIMTIQMTAGADSGTDEERLRHAMADPEIQRIMKDPTIIQVLKDLSTNGSSAQAQLKDPYIADCINKLVAAGVVKMG